MINAQDTIDDLFPPTLQEQLEWVHRDIPEIRGVHNQASFIASALPAERPYTQIHVELPRVIQATDPGEQIYGVNKEYYRKASQQTQDAIRISYLATESQAAVNEWQRQLGESQFAMNARALGLVNR